MGFHRTFRLLILILAGIAPLAADPAAAAQSHGAVMASLNASDPREILKAIYRDALEGKTDSGGAYILFDKRVRRGVFSKGFLALLKQAEAKVEPGDEGPIDFDPVTNSQDSALKTFTLAAEKQEDATAIIAVTLVDDKKMVPRTSPEDQVVRYDFVRENGKWKIDNIRGAIDGGPWSLRVILQESLTE